MTKTFSMIAISFFVSAGGAMAQDYGAALGPVGGTCKGCHDTYRTPQN